MTTDRNHLRNLASRASDDGYTGNDNYGHLTVSPAVLTELLDALDEAEARIRAVQDVLDKADADKAASGWQGSSVVRTAVVRVALGG